MPAAVSPESAAAEVDNLADAALALLIAQDPSWGAVYRLPGIRNNLLPDNSAEGRRRRHANEDGWLLRLRAIHQHGNCGSVR